MVTITDANGCVEQASARLSQPERSDWTMSGNAGTNPATQFIGTTDNKDLVFKSNNTEGLRLKADGGIQLKGNLSGAGILQRAGDGSLSLLTDAPVSPCGYALYSFWKTTGNAFSLCPDATIPKLGTLEGLPLDLITNGQLRLRITAAGQVGIGASAPLGDLHVHHAGAAKLVLSSTTGQASLWAQNSTFGYALATDADGNGHLLGNVNTPSSLLTFLPNGKVGVGATPPAGAIAGFRLFVQDGIATGRLGTTGSTPLSLMANGNEQVHVAASGKVGLGVVPPVGPITGYRLYVEDGIMTRDVLVKTGDWHWPDHVFAPGYVLMPLSELRAYLREHNHLPGMVSAGEVVQHGGVEVGDIQRRMLAIMEEQALYILQLEERLGAIEQAVVGKTSK